jgi:putative nucleotidyltransferase with HDIG domain
MKDRAEAWSLLTEWTKSDSLLKHSLSVEAAMRAYANRFGEDADLWGLTGLLHDFDYERHQTPDLHPVAGSEVLRANGYPEELIYAILSHAEYLNIDRKHPMDKTLFAVDELTGFITAVAMVRPSKNILDVHVSSIKKKMKDKPFARAVRREDIVNGANDLGVELDDHIEVVLKAMQAIATDLGLDGTAA